MGRQLSVNERSIGGTGGVNKPAKRWPQPLANGPIGGIPATKRLDRRRLSVYAPVKPCPQPLSSGPIGGIPVTKRLNRSACPLANRSTRARSRCQTVQSGACRSSKPLGRNVPAVTNGV